jgi:hypothetical protein
MLKLIQFQKTKTALISGVSFQKLCQKEANNVLFLIPYWIFKDLKNFILSWQKI